jgi:hypothetical protein
LYCLLSCRSPTPRVPPPAGGDQVIARC